jgi:hypothetical protein
LSLSPPARFENIIQTLEEGFMTRLDDHFQMQVEKGNAGDGNTKQLTDCFLLVLDKIGDQTLGKIRALDQTIRGRGKVLEKLLLSKDVPVKLENVSFAGTSFDSRSFSSTLPLPRIV